MRSSKFLSFVLGVLSACGLALSAEGADVTATTNLTIVAGQEIKLGVNGGDNGGFTNYVSHTGSGSVGSSGDGYVMGSTKTGTTLGLSLTNSEQADYYLVWRGGAKDLSSCYTVTVSGVNNYKQEDDFTQVNTPGVWTPLQTCLLRLDDLPVGAVTVTLTITSSTGSAAGNFGYFKFVKASELTTISVPATSFSPSTADANGTLFRNSCTVESAQFSSTKAGTILALLLSFDRQSEFGFRYYSGAEECTANLNWRLLSSNGTQVWPSEGAATNAIGNTGSWNLTEGHTNKVGTCAAGNYVLYATVSDQQNLGNGYAGNWGNFTFTRECKVTVPSVPNATPEVKAGETSLGTTNGVYTVTSGNNVTVTYTADSDYTFDGNSTTNFTFTSIVADQTITAPTATLEQFTVTVPAVENAALSVTKGSGTLGTTNGVYTVDIHTSVTVTYTPESGYVITNGTATTSFTDVSENKEVSAPVLAKMSDIAIGSSLDYISIKDGTDLGKIKLTNCKVDSSNEGKTIGSTGDNTKIAINVYVQEAGLYYFSYQYGSEGYTAKLNWKLTDLNGNQIWPEGSGVVADEIADIGSWTLSPRHEHGFGNLAAGVYTLSAYVSDRTTTTGSHSYAGNYGNFRFGTGAVFGFTAPTPSDYMVISNGLAKGWVTLANCQIDTDASGAVSNDGKTIGGTDANTVFTIDVNVSAANRYTLSYMSSADGYSSKLNWALYDVEGVQVWPASGVVTDTINDNKTWTLTDIHTHDLGRLSAGVYTLRAYVSDQSGVDSSGRYHYAGNFGNFKVVATPRRGPVLIVR